MKKLIALLLAILMVFSLAACGAKEEPKADEQQEAAVNQEAAANQEAAEEQEPVDVVMWYLSGETDPESITNLPETVKKYYPWVNLIMEPLPGDSGPEKISIAYATNTCPDILLDGYSRISPAVNAGLTVDLTDVYEANKGVFYGAPTEGVRDGKNWYLPLYTGAAYCMVVNMDLARELGVEDLLPKDWITWSYDEFLDLCRAAKAANPNIYPMTLYAADQSSDAWDYAWILGNGAKILNDDHTATAVNEPGNREKIIEVLEVYQTLVKEGLVPDGVASMSDSAPTELFRSGQALLWSGAAYSYVGENYLMMQKGELPEFELNAVSMPTADGKEPPMSSSWGTTGFAVFNDNGNAEAAKLVVDAILKDQQTREGIVNEYGTLSVNNDVTVDYQNDEINAIMERGKGYTAQYATSEFGILEPFWSDFRGTFYVLKQDLFVGNITPEEFVEKWAANGDAAIENYLSSVN